MGKCFKWEFVFSSMCISLMLFYGFDIYESIGLSMLVFWEISRWLFSCKVHKCPVAEHSVCRATACPTTMRFSPFIDILYRCGTTGGKSHRNLCITFLHNATHGFRGLNSRILKALSIAQTLYWNFIFERQYFALNLSYISL